MRQGEDASCVFGCTHQRCSEAGVSVQAACSWEHWTLFLRTRVQLGRGKTMCKKVFSHLGLCCAYQHDTGATETLPASDTAAPTYHHAVFCNTPPQAIYSNTDIPDRAIHITAHYCMTQTGSVCVAAANQTHTNTQPHTVWHHQTSHVHQRGRSITAGERASLCNDDAYQCLSCKPCYWFSSLQSIVFTIYHAWKSAVMCLHRIQYPLLLMNTDKQLNLCIFFYLT